MLTQEQINQLNIAYQRNAAGKASDADRKNLEYAQAKLGYKPPAQTVQGGPVAISNPNAPVDPRDQFRAQGYEYLGTMDQVNNAVRQFGKDRVKNIAGDYFVIPKGLGVVDPNSPIPATGLSNSSTELSNVLGANLGNNTIDSDIAGLLSLYGSSTKSRDEYDELTTQLTDATKSLGQQGTDLQAELDRQGVGAAYEQVKELNLKASQLQGEIGKFDAETEQVMSNVEDQSIPTGLIQGQQAQVQKQRDLTRLAKSAELSSTIALAQAYQGNAQLGMELASKAIDIKYQPILANIEALRTQIGFASERMNREDKVRSDIIGKLIDIKEREIDEQKAKESQVQELAIGIASMGAPLDVVRNVQKMTDVVEAAQAAGVWKRQFDLAEEARQRSLSGSGSGDETIPESYELTSAQEQALIGAGLSTQDIQNIQDNIKDGYTVTDILNIPGLSDEQKNIIGSTFNVPEKEEQFLSTDYFASIYGGLGSKTLKKAAKEGGFGGFLGGFTGVSHKEQNRYLGSLMNLVDQYRNAGYTDQEILELMK